MIGGSVMANKKIDHREEAVELLKQDAKTNLTVD